MPDPRAAGGPFYGGRSSVTTSLPDGQAGALDTLIARLEAATGWDHRLDAEIAQAIGWTPPAKRFVEWWRDPDGRQHTEGPPHYTASIDAALMLVPEGHRPQLFQLANGGWIARVIRSADSETFAPFEKPGRERSSAPSASLAICFAALCARAASPATIAPAQDTGELTDEHK